MDRKAQHLSFDLIKVFAYGDALVEPHEFPLSTLRSVLSYMDVTWLMAFRDQVPRSCLARSY